MNNLLILLSSDATRGQARFIPVTIFIHPLAAVSCRLLNRKKRTVKFKITGIRTIADSCEVDR